MSSYISLACQNFKKINFVFNFSYILYEIKFCLYFQIILRIPKRKAPQSSAPPAKKSKPSQPSKKSNKPQRDYGQNHSQNALAAYRKNPQKNTASEGAKNAFYVYIVRFALNREITPPMIIRDLILAELHEVAARQFTHMIRLCQHAYNTAQRLYAPKHVDLTGQQFEEWIYSRSKS